jgi:threonine synthase
MKKGVLERYKDYLPVTNATPIFTLGEGDTPLVRSNRIVEDVGCGELYFKLEGCNPTGSFKDRGMVVAVAKAVEEGGQSIVCASTGNTSASAAAYGAYCGLPTIVIVPKGNVAKGKLAQAMAYGARIVLIDGNFDHALQIVRTLAQNHPIVLVNSLNPYRLHGQKTASFEIVEDMEGAPDYVFIPVGNAGNITAYWMGFTEALQMEWTATRPRMMGFQAEGAAPIVRGAPVKNPQTIASAIRVGNPASWQGALRVKEESGGVIDMVSDEAIMEAYKMMARSEGIFCEPASAAPLAGLLKLSRAGLHLKDKKVVCIVTGSGLKDPDSASRLEPEDMQECPAELPAVERALGLV